MKRNGRLTGGTETVRMVSTNKPGTKRDGKCESGSVIFEVVSDKIKKLHLLGERKTAAGESAEETAGTLSETRKKKFVVSAVFLYINASRRKGRSNGMISGATCVHGVPVGHGTRQERSWCKGAA
jgi:hypothetical protein